jgi:DNA-binding CsgD family transcriptional regulator
MENLTSRELDVLRLLARTGASNKMIAREIGIEPCTVKARLREALRKIGLRTRTQAALWYRDHGPGRQRIGDLAGEIIRKLGCPATMGDRAPYDAAGMAPFYGDHLPRQPERERQRRGEKGENPHHGIAHGSAVDGPL